MRPLKLTMQNFGPYRNETVDFTQFENVPLFLISGKTGSGKTTIFDGICYALFGETSGNERTPQQMRSSFAQAREKTVVQLKFEHQEKEYTVTREPKYDYVNAKGGTSSHQAKQSLKYDGVNGKEETLTKTSDIKSFIEDLLHLNAKQFTQIVLLPQQQFRKFLAADSADKENVLRQVFGTEIFEKWTEQIKTEVRELSKRAEQQRANLEVLKQNVNLTDDERKAVRTNQDWFAVVDEKIARNQQFVTDQRKILDHDNEKLQQSRKQLDNAKQLKKAFDERNQLEQERMMLEQQDEEIKQKGQKITLLEWAQSQRALIMKVSQQRTAVTDVDQRIKDAEKNLDRLKEEQHRQQKVYDELEKQAPAIEKLTTNVQRLKPKLDLYTEVQAAQQSLQDAQHQLEQVTQKTASLKENLAEKERQLEANQAQLQQIGDLTNLNDDLNQRKLQLNQLDHHLERLEQLNRDKTTSTQKLAAMDQAVASQRKTVAVLSDRANELQNYFAQNQINFYVKQLTPGKACPICGSTEHPHPAEIEVPVEMQAIKEADVRQAQAKYTQAVQKLSQLEEQQSEFQQQVHVAQQALDDELQKLNQENQTDLSFGEISDWRQKRERDFQTRKQEYDEAKTRQSQLTAQNTTLSQQQTELQNQFDKMQQLKVTAERKVAELDAQVKTQQKLLPAEFKTKAELENQLEQWQTQIEKFTTAQTANANEMQQVKEQQIVFQTQSKQLTERLHELSHELNQTERDLEAELQKQNETEPQLRNLISNLHRLPLLRTEVDEYRQKVRSNADQLAKVNEVIGKQELPKIDQLQTQVDDLENKLRGMQIKWGEHNAQLQSLKQIKHQASKLWDAYQKQQQHLDEVAKLSQIVSGGTSENKLGLERFVLREYFKEVLEVATQILEKITDGRYSFVLQQNAERNTARQTGLGIDVYDDEAGQTRSVHTLSGGESFIAALALALALGEVIQRQNGGTEIDTLFIDEGFGSLDEDALATAMETLRTLEGKNRMIGIISHVRELHAQIPDQINVVAHEGQSHLKYRHEG